MIDIVITANNLDEHIGYAYVDVHSSPWSSEKAKRPTRRGILEAILAFHKRAEHDRGKFNYWEFRNGIFLCSAYRPTTSAKNFLSIGVTEGLILRKEKRDKLDYVQDHVYYTYAVTQKHEVATRNEQYDRVIYSPLALTRFAHCTHATLQYLDGFGFWAFFPTIITAKKTRHVKGSRPPVFGEVITTAQQEEVVTLLIALEDLYDQKSPTPEWCFDSLQECLHSPVIYLGGNDRRHWKRLALTTTDHVLHTDKQRAYITLEGVIVKEILDL